MAKNYTLAEATKIIVENKKVEEIADIGKRFPVLAVKIAKLAAKAPDELVDFIKYMPDHITANKINSSIKKTIGDVDVEEEDDVDVEDAEDEVVKDTNKKASKKASDDVTSDTDYDNMNNAKMYKILGEMGKRKDCKEKYGDLSHDSMLKYLKKYGAGSTDADTGDEYETEEEQAGNEEEQAGKYDGKSAVELFKACKSRGIAVQPKKTTKYYIGLLEKADEEEAKVKAKTKAKKNNKADEEEWEDDDEWESVTPDEVQKDIDKFNEEEKKAKKSDKKASAKKVKKEEVEEEDDDDEWEI